MTLKWQNWISQEEGSRQFSQDAVAAFQAKCPNITIEVVGVPAEETDQAMKLAANTKSGPDVFQTQTYMTPAYAEIGLFAPITSLDDLKGKMPAAAVSSGTWKGDWSNPVWGLAPFILTYNKTVMQGAGLDPNKPPATFEELIQMSADIGKAGGGKTYGYCQDSGKGYLNGAWSLNMVYTYGGDLGTESGPTVNSPETVAAVKRMNEWYNMPGAWAQGIDVRQCRDLFAQNRVAFNFESSWARGIYRAQSGKGEAFDAEWGVIPVPAGPSGPGVGFDGSQGLAVASYSEHKAEAEAFIRFMISDPAITKAYLETVGFPTAIQDLWTDPAYQDPMTQTLLKASETARLPQSIHFQEAITSFGEALQNINAGGADIQTELDALQKKYEAGGW